MEITVTGQQLDVTEALRAYATEKLARLQKHFDRMTTANVVLRVEKTRHCAEATIHARGAPLAASAEGADMYAAIDALADKLDRQVLRHKEKTTDHHRHGGALKKQPVK
jgi:putative sigma-54 modulation protein